LGTSEISSWDDYYQVPPINESGDNKGKSKKITRIFTQDYKTIATFNFTSTSLQSAYNTVPDLRSSQLSFGLSVDLVWRPGLTFDNVELGEN
jgi:hypothetical protein